MSRERRKTTKIIYETVLTVNDLNTNRLTGTVFIKNCNTAVTVHQICILFGTHTHTHTHTHTFSHYKDVSLPSCVRQRCSWVCHKQEVQLHSFTTPEFGFSQWSASRSGRFTHDEKPWYPTQYQSVGVGVWKSAWRFGEENCCQLPSLYRRCRSGRNYGLYWVAQTTNECRKLWQI